MLKGKNDHILINIATYILKTLFIHKIHMVLYNSLFFGLIMCKI